MALSVYSADNPLSDVIIIEADFIRSYLKELPSPYAKLYLYCVYAVNASCSNIAQLASECGLTVEDVRDGLRYFADEKLIRFSEHPMVIELQSVKEAARLKQSQLPDVFSDFVDYFSALRSIVGGRELKPAEITKAQEWVEVYNLPQEVILLMVQHCVLLAEKDGKKGKSTFSYIDKVAASWALNGINTLEEAEHYLATYELEHHSVREIMLHIGIRRMPSIEEVKLYDKWTKSMGLSQEEIIAACSETTKTSNPSFAYLDGIITSLYKSNTDITTEALSKNNSKRSAAKEILKLTGIPGNVTQDLLDILDAAALMGFEDAAVKKIASDMSKRAYKSVGELEKQLANASEQKLFTLEALEREDAERVRYDGDIKKLFSAMGTKHTVTDSDRRLYAELRESKTAEELLSMAPQAADGYNKMRRLAEIANGKSVVKQTAAHNYTKHESKNYDSVFTDLDKMEDD